MNYRLRHIAKIVNAAPEQVPDLQVDYLLVDSRKLSSPATTLFFALQTARRNGHQFIRELYDKGVRNFVVSEKMIADDYPGAGFLLVENTLIALQELAAFHRKKFSIPIIGITGSNGKTIVKEWLFQLFEKDHHIVRSPKSYNSQTGVPLSVWQINDTYTLGIFEAGISEPGEMARLKQIIAPTIGVFTNIGEAHSEGFSDNNHKLIEKFLLFSDCEMVVMKDSIADKLIPLPANVKKFTWGNTSNADLQVIITRTERGSSTIQAIFQSATIEFTIPFSDEASISNALTCYATMLALGAEPEVISPRMFSLSPVNMRLELKKGVNHCSIINDSYSADMSSLQIALNFMDQQATHPRKTVIISDFLQTGISDQELYPRIMRILAEHNVSRVIGIGPHISETLAVAVTDYEIPVELYISTADFLNQFRVQQFRDETILVKGARPFMFEQIVQVLEQKVHQTVLEINLNAIASNLRSFQKILKPSTRIMAMVKAFAYGSGGAEIAGILQYHKVDYLGVAYADEGVELRKAGIRLPILVMNPEASAFDAIVDNNLEPELYSFELLQQFDLFLLGQGIQHYPVHIEIETGMNRLGFPSDEMTRLGKTLSETDSFRVQSVFSHLAASEESGQDEFTKQQALKFRQASAEFQSILGYSILEHIANSAAAIRHPDLQLDMVRLGIGLYGVNSAGTGNLKLNAVTTFKSTIAQIKFLRKGESVSYNRKAMMNSDSVIGTVRVGYADGYPRRLGNGVGKVLVKGQLVPVVGTVCMDMFMIDLTSVPSVREGDDVILFGEELPVQRVAEWADTIPYDIMTGISQRVKRVYFEE